MFDDERVPVLLRKLTLRIDDDDTADDPDDAPRVRICETTFRVPLLTYDRAARVRLPITGHCFGKDKLPLWGVHEVKFEPPDETYTVALHPAYDAPALATLELAKLQRVRVWRVNHDRRDLSLEFQLRHQLARGDAKDIAALMTAWEAGTIAITLSTIQIPMPYENDDAAGDAAPAPTTSRRRTH